MTTRESFLTVLLRHGCTLVFLMDNQHGSTRERLTLAIVSFIAVPINVRDGFQCLTLV